MSDLRDETDLRALRAQNPQEFVREREEASFRDLLSGLFRAGAPTSNPGQDGWEVSSWLGSGAYAEVWAAVRALLAPEQGSPVRVALKVYHASVVPTTVEADRRLGRLLCDPPGPSRPRHPHLLEVFGGGVASDGRWYLVLEQASGATLRGVLSRLRRCDSTSPDAHWLEALPASWRPRGNWPDDPVRDYVEAVCTGMRQIASALWHCVDIETRRVHLRPEDVLLREDGAVAVNPICIEGWLRDVESYRLAACVDTAIYRGPWSIDDPGRQHDDASLTYALGSIAYELLTRRPAIPAQENWGLAKQAMRNHRPVPLDSIIPELEASEYQEFGRLLAAVLGKDPRQIPPLSVFANGLSVFAAPSGTATLGRATASSNGPESSPGPHVS